MTEARAAGKAFPAADGVVRFPFRDRLAFPDGHRTLDRKAPAYRSRLRETQVVAEYPAAAALNYDYAPGVAGQNWRAAARSPGWLGEQAEPQVEKPAQKVVSMEAGERQWWLAGELAGAGWTAPEPVAGAGCLGVEPDLAIGPETFARDVEFRVPEPVWPVLPSPHLEKPIAWAWSEGWPVHWGRS